MLIKRQLHLGHNRKDLELKLMFIINHIFDFRIELLQHLREYGHIEPGSLSLLDNLGQLVTF